jgi:MFS family permease
MSFRRRLWPQHGLWQHADFLKLWSAQTISQVGSQISGLVLPLVAVLTLHASAFEVAALSVVDFLPFLLFTLPAGVWVDRLPRRPIMVIADVGRSLALVSIPVAVFVGDLTLSQLYVVGFATGTLTVFFEVAYQSYLPSLVERGELVEGNAKLETTRSLALTGGPALGGVLVHVLTAPQAVLVDAASFLWSAVFVSSIRRNEVAPERSTVSPSMWRELTEGIRYIFGHQYWRAITVATAIYNFFNYVAFAVLVVYMLRHLHMSALAIGVTLSLSNGLRTSRRSRHLWSRPFRPCAPAPFERSSTGSCAR